MCTRLFSVVPVLGLALIGSVFAQTKNVRAQRNDLLAHDINGFSLGMTIPQVQAIAHEPLQSIGAGQYQVIVDGVAYDFGFSILGHLFRIDSKQNIGHS